MTDFLSLAAAYYLCSNAAMLHPLTARQAATCGAVYERVKLHFDPEMDRFAPGTPDRLRRNRAAYLAFKTWEEENAGLVSQLKESARPIPSRHRVPPPVVPGPLPAIIAP